MWFISLLASSPRTLSSLQPVVGALELLPGEDGARLQPSTAAVLQGLYEVEVFLRVQAHRQRLVRQACQQRGRIGGFACNDVDAVVGNKIEAEGVAAIVFHPIWAVARDPVRMTMKLNTSTPAKNCCASHWGEYHNFWWIQRATANLD